MPCCIRLLDYARCAHEPCALSLADVTLSLSLSRSPPPPPPSSLVYLFPSRFFFLRLLSLSSLSSLPLPPCVSLSDFSLSPSLSPSLCVRALAHPNTQGLEALEVPEEEPAGRKGRGKGGTSRSPKSSKVLSPEEMFGKFEENTGPKIYVEKSLIEGLEVIRISVAWRR